MSTPQQRHDRRKAQRNLDPNRRASNPAPELSPVAAAIMRGPHSRLDGRSVQPVDVSPMPENANTHQPANTNHPVDSASQLLFDAGHDTYAINLREYHRSQCSALEKAMQRADLAERAHGGFMEAVALTLDLAPESNGEEVLEALRARILNPQPLTADLANVTEAQVEAIKQAGPQGPLTIHRDEAQPHLQAVCRVLAKHFADDPAVTFENAAGLVQHLIDDGNNAANQFNNERDRADKLLATLKQEQEKGQQVGEKQISPDTLRALVSQFGGGLPTDPIAALREMLINLKENQQPEGWKQHVEVLVQSNKRYEAVLATIQNAVQLA